MNSAEAREYVRLATTETKGRVKTACDLLIDESVKLNKIEQIIKDYDGTTPSMIKQFSEIQKVLDKG